MQYAVVNGTLVTPALTRRGGVLVENEKIAALLEAGACPEGCHVVDAGGGYIVPGFIDLHTHGGGGADFSDGTAESYQTAAGLHLRHGTTAMTPTILACAPRQMQDAMDAYDAAAKAWDMPEFLGLHLEGPYFAHSMRGAQDARYLKNPDPDEYEAILNSRPYITRWSLAPELPGGLAMGLALRRRGIVAAIAHSDAAHEDVARAAEHGFSLITHFYSAMSTIRREKGYRIPGVVESGLLFDEFSVELIADGHHLPPALLSLVYKAKSAARICLVTDSMRAAGMGEGPSILGSLDDGMPVEVKDGVAVLPDGSGFAGSVATTDHLLRTAVEAGIPLCDAVRMLTLTPARVMGVDGRIGSLTPGKDADIVVLDRSLHVVEVLAKGRAVVRGR